MGKRLSEWFRRITNGWVALAALAFFLLFSALVLPGQSGSSETQTGDAGTPDLSLYYSVDDLYRMAEAYGQEGRAAYVRARFTFDLVWPLVYTLFLSAAISWLFGVAFAPDSRWQRANLAPVVGAMLDYLENVSTSVVMLRYPDRTPVLDTLAPLFTLTKWVFVGGSFVLLLVGAVVGLWRWYERRSPE